MCESHGLETKLRVCLCVREALQTLSPAALRRQNEIEVKYEERNSRINTCQLIKLLRSSANIVQAPEANIQMTQLRCHLPEGVRRSLPDAPISHSCNPSRSRSSTVLHETQGQLNLVRTRKDMRQRDTEHWVNQCQSKAMVVVRVGTSGNSDQSPEKRLRLLCLHGHGGTPARLCSKLEVPKCPRNRRRKNLGSSEARDVALAIGWGPFARSISAGRWAPVVEV